MLQRFNELSRRRVGKRPERSLLRVIKDSAVFGDDPVEQHHLREDAMEVIDLAAGDKDELPSGRGQPSKRLNRLRIDRAVLCQRPVVVGGKREVPHLSACDQAPSRG